MWALLSVILALFVPYTRCHVIHDGGTCGADAVPYRIAIDSKGSPKLSCLTPKCLSDDLKYGNTSTGGHRSAVKCKPFKDIVCTGELQWTGGLIEVNNGTHNVLNAACCAYPEMARSQLVRTIFLGQDDIYEGGFREKAGDIKGFDLIKEVRKSVNGDNRIRYIITIHRIPCRSDDKTSLKGNARTSSRNKRRLDDTRKEHEIDYEYEENDRQHRYRDQAERPTRRTRRPGMRRRPAMRDYDDYYDYDYAVIVPRQMISRRRQSGNRLWPVARVHADGGIFETNDVIPIKEQDVIVSSGSAADEFSQLPPLQQQIQVSATPYSSIDAPLPPSPPASYASQQPLPQYVPAYREPAAYTPAPYQVPATQPVQFRMPIPTPQPNNYARLPQAAQVPIQQAQPAQYYYYPGYYQPGGGLNGFFEQMQCFSGDMEVETPSGTKAIRNLEVGDMVLSIDESMVTFSPVIMFLHKLDGEKAQFLRISLESGESLKLTENHLIYITNCENVNLRLVSAKEAKVDQCVQVTDSATKFTSRRIASIERVTGVGIYAPLTSTGDIMVNHVLVSCHSNLALKTLQQTFFSVYRGLSSLLRDYTPSILHDNTHLPLGVHYLTTMRNFRVLWLVSLILETTYGLNTVSDLITLQRLKNVYWLPMRSKKEEVDKIANRHMLKQPLMKFDLLWKKFHGGKRSPTPFVLL